MGILYMRIGQVAFGLFAIFSLTDRANYPAGVFGVGILIAVEYFLYQVVHARLVDEGIEYRRRGKWILVRWEEIDTVTAKSYQSLIVVKLAGCPPWSRYLLLMRPTPSLSQIRQNNQSAEKFASLISR
jgi:hypothetical protein